MQVEKKIIINGLYLIGLQCLLTTNAMQRGQNVIWRIPSEGKPLFEKWFVQMSTAYIAFDHPALLSNGHR